jgi:hypothetical protein
VTGAGVSKGAKFTDIRVYGVGFCTHWTVALFSDRFGAGGDIMNAIKVSDQQYAVIESAANAEGIPAEAWVVAHLTLECDARQSVKARPASEAQPARTMADLFAGRVGVVASTGDGRLSENTGERFADILVEKRREGRL